MMTIVGHSASEAELPCIPALGSSKTLMDANGLVDTREQRRVERDQKDV